MAVCRAHSLRYVKRKFVGTTC